MNTKLFLVNEAFTVYLGLSGGLIPTLVHKFMLLLGNKRYFVTT